MSQSKKTKSFGRESFLIFVVMGVGILATLSLHLLSKPTTQEEDRATTHATAPSQSPVSQKTDKSIALIDVPLATGEEPLEKLFVQSGCAVCHTIPGIEPAQGRQGPKLVLGTNGPNRLADSNYQGAAESVREYIQESILSPSVYIVPGYSDRVMPRWYGKRLNAKSLDRIAHYLEGLEE
ncbi:MAG: c-type cytochrome [Nitrospirales bacterium]